MNGDVAVMVVVSLQRAEETLLAGDMPFSQSQGVLRRFGTGRTRSIAARFERPESTVRRWLRAARAPHAQWL